MMKIRISARRYDRNALWTKSAALISLALVLFALLWLSGCDSSEPTPNPLLDQSTPQATIENLYLAVYLEDSDMFKALLDPDDPDRNRLVKAFKRMKEEKIRFDVSDIKIDIVEEEPDMVRLRARFRQKILVNGLTIVDEQNGAEHTLIKKNGRWYLSGQGQSPPPGWILDGSDWLRSMQTITAPQQ
jgi:hypothetical protein